MLGVNSGYDFIFGSLQHFITRQALLKIGWVFYHKMRQLLQSVTFVKNASAQSTPFKF